MMEIDDRIPGQTIESAYANTVRDRVLQRYATEAIRDTQTPTPGNGELAFIEDALTVQVYVSGAGWRTLASYDDNPAAFVGTLTAFSLSCDTVITGDLQLTRTGTAAVPSIRYDVDFDTGIYRPATNELGMSVGGVEQVRIDSTGVKIVNVATQSLSFFDQWQALAGYEPVCRKDSSGFVIVEGITTNQNGVTADSSTFQRLLRLPEGYRPLTTRRFTCSNNIAQTVVLEAIPNDGNLEIVSGTVPSTGWVTLSTLRFYAGWA